MPQPTSGGEPLAVCHEMDVFDDIRDGIERLDEAGYNCFMVSNGDHRMLASLDEDSGIGDFVESTVSADEMATFKLTAKLYRHAANQDVCIDHEGAMGERIYAEPVLRVTGFDDLADCLRA